MKVFFYLFILLFKQRLKVTATGGNLVLGGNGSGVDSLKDSLHDDEVAFVLLTLRLTLQGIPDQPRHVFIHWKGPACKKMVVVQSNQKYQEALHLLSVNYFLKNLIIYFLKKKKYNSPIMVN